MAAYIYRAKIEHTEDTIFKLYKTQYHAYEQSKMLVRMVIGIALIFVAAFVSFPIWARGLILLVGAWLIVSLDFPSQMKADKVIEERGGSLPKMEYEFYESEMKLSGEGSMNIKYKKFSRLLEDSGYLYLFISRDSVCMIDRSTLKPDDNDKFKKFISEKTGLEWCREQSMLSMNLYDIKRIFKERKMR